MQMEKQQFYKMVPYDASASVPMVIFDGRPGRTLATKVVTDPTQLIDIYPTILELAQVEKDKWPSKLDGHSLLPMLNISVPGNVDADRPDFVVSQFHGDNIAMSWFAVVSKVDASTTYKLIVWGTGAEVPSLLFNLLSDPNEDNNLIATAKGAAAYASVVSDLEAKIRTVVDYPTVAMAVAQYGRDSFAGWTNRTPGWQDELHHKGMRWDPSWDAAGTPNALKAISSWMAQPVTKLTPCRLELKRDPPGN